MLDIIIVICCILGGFALGKYIEKKIADKGKFYQDLARYVSLLKDNISSRQLELEKFNAEFTKSCGKSFADYLACGKIKLRLTKPQKDNVAGFFDNLDCVSSQALSQHIDYYGSILVDDAKAVQQNEVARSPIYSKLGMLLGAMLGILLV